MKCIVILITCILLSWHSLMLLSFIARRCNKRFTVARYTTKFRMTRRMEDDLNFFLGTPKANKVIVISGTTAVGKSAVAQEFCDLIGNAEIVIAGKTQCCLPSHLSSSVDLISLSSPLSLSSLCLSSPLSHGQPPTVNHISDM